MSNFMETIISDHQLLYYHFKKNQSQVLAELINEHYNVSPGEVSKIAQTIESWIDAMKLRGYIDVI